MMDEINTLMCGLNGNSGVDVALCAARELVDARRAIEGIIRGAERGNSRMEVVQLDVNIHIEHGPSFTGRLNVFEVVDLLEKIRAFQNFKEH